MRVSGGVLIIDDDAGIQRALSSVLGKQYPVQVASTGEEGLRECEHWRPDLVLLDVMLPETSGVAVLRQIKQRNADIPVVMMTAYAQVHTAVEAIKIGALDYLEKPFDTQRLFQLIESVLSTPETPAPAYREGVIGESAAMQRVWRMVERFGPTDIPVLFQGETGTGKGAFARALHQASKRVQGPFIDVDCGTIPEQLAESELFGYEDGAFTGAGKKKIGRVAFAHRGTLFLDEIGVLSLASQAKLLTVIEQQRFVPLGARDARAREVDVRFVTATNVPLRDAVRGGTFREDLYHRLDGITIELPPLREREGDIELLASYFLHKIRKQYSKRELEFSLDALDLLRSYKWPGNVRELQRTVTSAVVMADRVITPDDLPAHIRKAVEQPELQPAPEQDGWVDEIGAALHSGARLDLGRIKEWAGREAEKRVIVELKKRTSASQQELARLLGIDPKTLRARLKEIDRADS